MGECGAGDQLGSHSDSPGEVMVACTRVVVVEVRHTSDRLDN